MGNHRAERSTTSRGPSETPTETGSTAYVGRRVAGRTETPVAPAIVVPAVAARVAHDPDATTQLPRVTAPGKRRAVKHSGSRGPLFKGVPSAPLLLGVATLAIAVGGTLMAGTDAQPASAHSTVRPATALSGSSGVGNVDTLRSTGDVSRDFDRSGSGSASTTSDPAIAEAAKVAANKRVGALDVIRSDAEKQARKLNDDRWVVPLHPVVLTARFGEYGLWSSMHTGLDFNGETGDPIYSIAAGVVTFVGYDGSYGNKTVVTLPDGTELWYCHQTTQYVSVGDAVAAEDVIGTVGTTGNVTGSHLHVEVRPGGGDPVDPYAAFVQHGVIPEEG